MSNIHWKKECLEIQQMPADNKIVACFEVILYLHQKPGVLDVIW